MLNYGYWDDRRWDHVGSHRTSATSLSITQPRCRTQSAETNGRLSLGNQRTSNLTKTFLGLEHSRG